MTPVVVADLLPGDLMHERGPVSAVESPARPGPRQQHSSNPCRALAVAALERTGCGAARFAPRRSAPRQQPLLGECGSRLRSSGAWADRARAWISVSEVGLDPLDPRPRRRTESSGSRKPAARWNGRLRARRPSNRSRTTISSLLELLDPRRSRGRAPRSRSPSVSDDPSPRASPDSPRRQRVHPRSPNRPWRVGFFTKPVAGVDSSTLLR